jgi:adenine-specific DNA methylase
MLDWASNNAGKASGDSLKRLLAVQKDSSVLDDPVELRKCLLDFIADFADWDHSTDPAYLACSRRLVQLAHESLGGAHGTRPLVVDPFAGGGAIPLEALRVGADAFASDINRLAVLLERVTLSVIPKMGQDFAAELRKWGSRVLEVAKRGSGHLYGPSHGSAHPVAFIWARTVQCEGPGCGCEIPMLGSMWLAKKRGRSWAIVPHIDKKAKTIELLVKHNPRAAEVSKGFCDGGAALCPVCGFTTAVTSVRRQLRERRGGSWDARLVAVVETSSQTSFKTYRQPSDAETGAVASLAGLVRQGGCWLPEAPLPPKGTLGFRIQNYGMQIWADIFLPRQLLVLNELATAITGVRESLRASMSSDAAEAVYVCLGLALGKCVDYSNALCRWVVGSETKAGEFVGAANGGENKLSMKWDFVEANPLADGSGSWEGVIEWMARVCDHIALSKLHAGVVERASATAIPLPDESADAVITDPPYYDAFAYAALADMFYVWLRRIFGNGELFDAASTMTAEEIIADESAAGPDNTKKDKAFFESSMRLALASCRRISTADGIAVVVFAHKGTASWEALLAAFVDSGWTVVASWPLDTERAARPRALRSAALGSSIHIVGRKRLAGRVGDWRDILAELPPRIHEWLLRLAEEGVVGADAIFACLGPALEIYSRYDRVETAGGDPVPLGDTVAEDGKVVRRGYLSYVWEAVAQQALRMIFSGADASGFEEDARLTAIWLWTLSTGVVNGSASGPDEKQPEESADTEDAKSPIGGFPLEYDAARKISQGLGVHMEELITLVELRGDTARLLSVAERTRALFGKEGDDSAAKRRKGAGQLRLGFASELEDAEESGAWGANGGPKQGRSVLDRIHQAMLLFGAGRTDVLKRFLVQDGVGADVRLWRLAQALSALYPIGSDEKRWVDGVLGRKKGLGF